MKLYLLLWLAGAGAAFSSVYGQTKQPASLFDAQPLFAQDFFTNNGNLYRSANGAPGPKYWQNRADYTLQAAIDTNSDVLTGSETIYYTNNSPDTLPSLWLQLDQNTYRSDARSGYYAAGKGYTPQGNHTEGFVLDDVATERAKKKQKADYIITDTRLQIRLPQALPPGATIFVHIQYHYTIPGEFGGRTDVFTTQNGKIYEVAQWYPRMCVYDDLEGWSTLPFLGSGEFYCEYGDFDYTITVPAGVIVAGSGELQNEAEVLTAAQQQRLQAARGSNATLMIRTAVEVNNDAAAKTAGNKTKSWHFTMHNTRDVAFGASAAYLWDAAKVNLPNGKPCLAMSVYPVESVGDSAWNRATEYLKKSIEYFSLKWFVYPYPTAVNEAGIAAGMEYPGIVFDGMYDKGSELYWVTAHEIGHNWFPMIVGSNERRHAWMDEGLNTFIDIYASDNFNKGEYAPKRDAEYAPGGGNPADEILPLLRDTAAPSMMVRADRLPEKYRHDLVYFKPALGLVLLREVVLGSGRFDYAFKQYINRWAFKHPSPNDFFRTMNNEAGEDLSWFWKEWFVHNWQLDMAVTAVEATNGDGGTVVNITVSNLQRMAMPFTLLITATDGTTQRLSFPVETWLQGGERTLPVLFAKQVAKVTIDPDNMLPDSNRNNNVWRNTGR